MQKILVTGAIGQIGSELTMVLREKYGYENVIASDYREPKSGKLLESGPFELVNCLNIDKLTETVKNHDITTIYHLAAILSAVAEDKPQYAWDVNINGLYNVLEIAREQHCAVFTPSSIGAYGPNTPKNNTPQDTIQRPNTMYGVTKVSGELLCDYYFHRFGVDTRGLRYPGIISNETLPGGGTTDYAVDIFYEAVKNKKYTCFLKQDTYLDMMYMPDAINAAINLMEADSGRLNHRNAFNVTAMSICPNDTAIEIKKIIPEFKMDYDVDPIRQAIADSWPNNIDDSAAVEEWDWKPQYNLQSMVKDMIDVLNIKLQSELTSTTSIVG